MKKLALASIVLFFISCQVDDYGYEQLKNNELDKALDFALLNASGDIGKSFYILPSSTNYAAIPQDPLNPITTEKVALGKLLLHETATGGIPKMESMKYQYACASCHPVASGFNSGRRQGIGEGGIGFGLKGEGRTINFDMPVDSIDIEPIRPPTLLNLAYQDVMLWNGSFGGTGTNSGTESRWETIPENSKGFQGIEVQAMQGQDAHRLLIDANFADTFGYTAMFDAAFPDVPKNKRYTRETGGLAIAAYNRTLLANQAPWQYYLKGDKDAITPKQKRGALLFFDAGRCYECHNGPALKDNGFYAFGMGDFDNSQDAIILSNFNFLNFKKGRGGFTGNSSDDYKFKTPTLYNLADNKFYGHGGTFTSIREVIRYKNDGVPENSEVPSTQLAPQFGSIDLSEEEIEQLTAFLTYALRDDNLRRYVPEQLNSGMCFPNNDPQSRVDVGCD